MGPRPRGASGQGISAESLSRRTRAQAPARPGLDVGSPGALRWWDSYCELVGTGRTGRAACPLPTLLGHGRHLLLREHPWVPQHPPPPSPLPLPSPPPSVLTPLTLISTFTCMGTPQVRGQAHSHGSPLAMSSSGLFPPPWLWGHLGGGTHSGLGQPHGSVSWKNK